MSATVQPRDGAAVGADLAVVAGSLGAISACSQVLAGLPADFPVPLVVVQHHRTHTHVLASLLQRRTRLCVVQAQAGVQPRAGTVYVADGDRQLLVDGDGRLHYEQNGAHRCLADPLLASAACVHSDRLLALILSGRLDDGARGVAAVSAAGGRVLVQDAASCVAFGMPAAAISTGCVDFVLPLTTIPAALITLAMLPAAAELFRVSRGAVAAAASD